MHTTKQIKEIDLFYLFIFYQRRFGFSTRKYFTRNYSKKQDPFFFRTICKISKRWKYRNRSKGLLFLNFPLKFGKSTEEKRKHDVKDVPKYVLGESNRGGEEEWWKREPAGRKQRREKVREEARRRGKIEEPLTFMQTMGEHRFRRYFGLLHSLAFPLVPWNSWTATFLYFRTRLNHREGFPTASQWERIRSLSRTAHVAPLLGLFRIRSIASLISLIELPENSIRKR